VNKKAENYVSAKQNQEEQQEVSSKWNFKALRKYFEEKEINFDYVYAQMKDVIVKTLIAVEPQIVSNLNQ